MCVWQRGVVVIVVVAVVFVVGLIDYLILRFFTALRQKRTSTHTNQSPWFPQRDSILVISSVVWTRAATSGLFALVGGANIFLSASLVRIPN